MDTNVDADDIAIAQSISGTWNTMTDDIVDGGAYSGRKGGNSGTSLLRGQRSIAFVAGNGPSTANIFFSNFIDFGGRNTGYQVRAQHFICLGNDASRLVQLRDLLF